MVPDALGEGNPILKEINALGANEKFPKVVPHPWFCKTLGFSSLSVGGNSKYLVAFSISSHESERG